MKYERKSKKCPKWPRAPLYIMIGMIEPVRIALPVGAEDFVRHILGRDQ